jgi:hypothetical protein
VSQALAALGPAQQRAVREFLFAMITKDERPLVEVLLPEPVERAAAVVG